MVTILILVLKVTPAFPTSGTIFLSVRDSDKPIALELAREFIELGFTFVATPGTAKYLEDNGIETKNIFRVSDGARPNVIDLIKNDQIQLVVNISSGMIPRIDENKIRAEAILRGICVKPTLSGARAALSGIKALKERPLDILSLQEYRKTP